MHTYKYRINLKNNGAYEVKRRRLLKPLCILGWASKVWFCLFCLIGLLEFFAPKGNSDIGLTLLVPSVFVGIPACVIFALDRSDHPWTPLRAFSKIEEAIDFLQQTRDKDERDNAPPIIVHEESL